ncbi:MULTISPECIES: recombinase family protein [Micrococcus]|uniref:recombinase family protein n=1 Tax=Micrococcus TaxID=1269 RepID=UPI0019D1AC44|nr:MULTISPECIES: recombinase family protein [Micrococcus]MBO1028716.1 recombinase family protein [Micrococcus luteus]MCV7660112.1 recombinase family protein [Micrococcus luteus]MCV7662051.1 recombinase family protein [Micrococcus luteus]
MRAAIYLRISLDRHGDGLAVERQREDCKRIIAQRGWEHVATYEDPSVSASSRTVTRPGYERMVRDWQAGRFDAVVCWDLDRLTRQPRQLEDWIDAAEQRGLHLVTANGEADLGTDAGRMFARIKAAVSRQEVDRKSARQVRAAQQRAELGKGWGPRRPFGFAEDKVAHDPAEAAVVRRMYDDFNAGVGQREICRRLAAEGVRTSTGREWTQPALRQFLRNPRNAGLRAYRGEIIGPAEWAPLVSESVYRAALDRMDAPTKRVGGSGAKHLLIGVARCGVCDSPVGTNYTATHKRQYACRAGHVARSAEAVDAYVSEVAVGVLSTRGAAAFTRHDDAGQVELSAEADRIRARQEALAVEFADGTLTAAQLRAANARMAERLEQVTAAMVAAEGNAALRPLLEAESVAAGWERLDIPRRRAVIDTLMNVRILRTSQGSRFDPASVEITPRTG